MADDMNPDKSDGGRRDATDDAGTTKPRSSLDDRPSSEFLGEERLRISIVRSDSGSKTAASQDLDDDDHKKDPVPTRSESGNDEDEEEDDDDGENILSASLTEAWEEKTYLSMEYASAAAEEKEMQYAKPAADEKPQRSNSASSAASHCSNCGHHRCDSVRSSVTLAHGPQSPTIPPRTSSLNRTGTTYPAPLAGPTTLPSGTLRAFPLCVKKVPSRAVSDGQTFHSAQEEQATLSEPHSETASIMSAIFATPLRHLASHPSLNGAFSAGASPSTGPRITPVTEQRHPGKASARISRFTRPFEPDIHEEGDGEAYLQQTSNVETPRTEKRESSTAHRTEETCEEVEWVEGWPLAFLMLGICLVVFLISVDRRMQAIPYITSDFQSTGDIGWYGSAYLLTACAFQPVFGRTFMLFSVKWSYMLAMFMFLVGSLVCGVAPNSVTLIIGRAVAGFGSAGILTGSFVVVSTAVPLQQRPIYTAVVGLTFGFGATVGPLLGGVFTDLVTWRWCFYMNLPVGAVTVAVFLLFFHPKRPSRPQQKFFDRVMNLDLVGNVLLLGACVMLFLALEFATQGEAWSSTRVIGLLSGAGVTAVVFAGWQWWKQDGALMPPAIMTQRTVAASCVAAFTTCGALMIHSYFLPIWFQAIKGENAISSGVDMIPYVATNAFFSLLSGIFVSVVGYYVPPAVVGGMIATAGCGVLRLLSPETPTAQLIGFEMVVSAGLGMSIQQGFTAVQAVLPPDEISIGTAAVVASQSLGGAIFISVGNTLFQNHLLQDSAQNVIPGVNIRAVLEGGATAFRTAVPDSALPALLTVYNEGLRLAFTAAIPLAGVSAIAACFMEWKSTSFEACPCTT